MLYACTVCREWGAFEAVHGEMLRQGFDLDRDVRERMLTRLSIFKQTELVNRVLQQLESCGRGGEEHITFV